MIPVKWAEIMAGTPEIHADGVFRIAADGTWYHDGAPIERRALVRLFASVLMRDHDGDYWLVTPAEKVPVAVEDAPFVAVELAGDGAGRSACRRFRTNVDTWVPLDRDHPLTVRPGAAGPRPYLAVGGGLEARIARSVYYRMAEAVEPGPDGTPGICSAGTFFPLVPEGERVP